MARMLRALLATSLLLGGLAAPAGGKPTRVVDRAWTLASDGERFVVFRPYPIVPELGVIDSQTRRVELVDTRPVCSGRPATTFELYGTVAAGRVLLPCGTSGDPVVYDLRSRTRVTIPAVPPPQGLDADLRWYAIGRAWVAGYCVPASCRVFRNLRSGRWVVMAPAFNQTGDDADFDLDRRDGLAWRPCAPWRPGIDGVRYGDRFSDGRWVTWWEERRAPGESLRISRCGGARERSLGATGVDIGNAVPSYSAGWVTWNWNRAHAYQPATGRHLRWRFPLADTEGSHWGDIVHTRYAAYLASVREDLGDKLDFLVYGIHEARLPR